MVEGVNSSMIDLIYSKTLCKYHNVHQPNTTIKQMHPRTTKIMLLLNTQHSQMSAWEDGGIDGTMLTSAIWRLHPPLFLSNNSLIPVSGQLVLQSNFLLGFNG
jgi:hypothetical protein